MRKAASKRARLLPAATDARTRLVGIGLMCAADGCPVAVEVFEGNTADPMTLAVQIDKLKQRFKLRVPVDRDHGFRWKMITQSGGT